MDSNPTICEEKLTKSKIKRPIFLVINSQLYLWYNFFQFFRYFYTFYTSIYT